MEKLVQQGRSSLISRLLTGLLFLLLFMAPQQIVACCCTSNLATEKPLVSQALLYERVGFPKAPESTLVTDLKARVLRREIGKGQAWDQTEQLETAAQAAALEATIWATKVALPPRKHNLLPAEARALLSHLFLYDTYILQRDGVQRLAAMPVRLELQFQIGRYFLEHEGLDNYNRGVRQEIVGGHTYVWAPGVLVPTSEVHRRLTACKAYYYDLGRGGIRVEPSASLAMGKKVRFGTASLVRFYQDAAPTSIKLGCLEGESVTKEVAF